MNLEKWKQELEIELVKLAKIDLNYPQGEDKIFPVDISGLKLLKQSVSVPTQLEAFYRECGGISLPDVWNGYFIDSPQMILKGIEIGEPTKIIGSINCDIVAFGSDIGGHRLSIRCEEPCEVLYMPHGLLENGVFEETTKIKTIAQDFYGFLDRLLEDTRAWVRRDEDWEYMDSNLYGRE